MSINNYLIKLRAKMDNSPELKIRIMWLLDKLPMVKDSLKKIGQKDEKKDIQTYNDLSSSAKEIYLKIQSKAEVNR
jgi:hypothetical protein